MAKGLFTALFNALSDPKSYYAMQKEMNLHAVAQTFFNSLAGKTSFQAVVLPEDIGSPVVFDGTKAVRVRPLGIYDLIIPEPCEFKDVATRKRMLALHPIAYPITNGEKIPESLINEVKTVECFFGDGPQSSGRLRQLTYRPNTLRSFSTGLGLNFDCLKAEAIEGELKNMFEKGEYGEFVGPPSPGAQEKNLELKELAAKVGLTETILKAIREVESKGNLTAIRFEPHIFLRYRKDLSNVIPYKPLSDKVATDYTPSHTNKNAFDRAFKLDGPAAIKSTSFGLYQIVSKFADLSKSSSDIIKNALKNQESAQNFVNFFYQKPLYVSDQLLIAWFSANPTAAKFAKQKKWREFALRYNGIQCCGPKSRNKYDEKLKAAYEKFSKMK